MPHLDSRALLLGTFGLGLVGIQAGSAMAQNLDIIPTFGSSITSLSDAAAVESSINAAITTLETDVTTIAPDTVAIEFDNVPTGLGQSLTPQADLDYSTYLGDLQANPNKSAIQTQAYSTLPAGPNTGINNATQVNLTAANLAAIGETATAASLVSGNGGYNGDIGLNLSLMNAARPGSNPDNYDLQSVAAHEIDEVLGIGGNGSQLYQGGATPPTSLPADIGPLDLYRYSAAGVRSFTYNPNTSAFFSINGGKTNLVYFNQQNGANGADFGDWGNPQGTQAGNTPPQTQDAYGSPGDAPNLGRNELIALNAIGYELTPAGAAIAAVPEPSTYWMMLTGFMGLLGFKRWRKGAQGLGSRQPALAS